MSKEVRNRICPTCGTDHHEVKTFSIPEVSVVEVAALKEGINSLGEKISTMKPTEVNLQPIEEKFKQLDENMSKLAQGLIGHPKPKEVIKDWSACPDCGPEWNGIKREIVDEALLEHHPVLNDRLIEHFSSCPTCKPAFDELKRQIEQEVLERAKEVTTGATTPAKPASFWGV